MKNKIVEKFVADFESASDVTTGINNAFNKMTLKDKITDIQSKYSNALKYFNITDANFNCYYEIAERESLEAALTKLSFIEQELKQQEKELDQSRKMGLHAASGKFGNAKEIDLSDNN